MNKRRRYKAKRRRRAWIIMLRLLRQSTNPFWTCRASDIAALNDPMIEQAMLRAYVRCVRG